MRTVQVYKWIPPASSPAHLVEDGVATFHHFGTDYEEFDNGGVSYSVAILEREDGTVLSVPVSRIKFIKPDSVTLEQANKLLQEDIERLKLGLSYYARGEHFIRHDDAAWNTVSGEPDNLFEDEACTATVEDGSVAKAILEGKSFNEEGNLT